VGDAVAGWEARGERVPADAGDVFVLDVPGEDGNGAQPLLVLHGFPTCSFDWRHVLPALARHRRVVLLDFLGFGLSAKPDLRYGIRLHADTTEAVAARLGLERVALLTHDMGDSVGGELLARELEGTGRLAVSRRVLTNGSIYLDLAQLTAGQQLLLSLPDERTPGLGADGGAAFRQGLAATFSPDHAPSEEELDAQWQLVSREGGSSLLARTIRYIEDRRVDERRFTGAIERHPSPLGVVWGQLDPVAVPAMTSRLLVARPGTPVVPLDGIGHYPMVEAPELFADTVLELLDG